MLQTVQEFWKVWPLQNHHWIVVKSIYVDFVNQRSKSFDFLGFEKFSCSWGHLVYAASRSTSDSYQWWKSCHHCTYALPPWRTLLGKLKEKCFSLNSHTKSCALVLLTDQCLKPWGHFFDHDCACTFFNRVAGLSPQKHWLDIELDLQVQLALASEVTLRWSAASLNSIIIRVWMYFQIDSSCSTEWLDSFLKELRVESARI